LHQPHLGPVRVEGCARSAVAWLSDGRLAIPVECNGYRLAEGGQYLGLKIETNHIRLVGADTSHGLSSGGWGCDVGNARSSFGQ
jgi:hypothetical protein